MGNESLKFEIVEFSFRSKYHCC